jgi:hypothetical protein
MTLAKADYDALAKICIDGLIKGVEDAYKLILSSGASKEVARAMLLQSAASEGKIPPDLMAKVLDEVEKL